ncbi:MAG: GAF domain-containing protein [Chloroflexota bacterium]|nr:GAF domain-containing protein [Chloroflexota bacterium]
MANEPRDRGAGHDALISVAQAAARLGVHPNTIRSWSEAGRLKAYRINARGDRRFRPSDLERLLVEGGEPVAVAALSDYRDPRLAVLGKLARTSASSSNIGAVCRVAVEALRADCGFDRAAIYLESSGILSLETHAGYRVPPEPVFEYPGGPDGERLASGPLPWGNGVVVPLRGATGPLGCLLAEGHQTMAATGQLPFLEIVAHALGAAVRNAGLLKRVRRELTRARALRGVTQELTGQLDLAAVLDDVVARTHGLFEADKAGLWLIDATDHPFSMAAQRGLTEEFLTGVSDLTWQSDTIGVQALRDRRPYVMRNAGADEGTGLMRSAYAREGIRTVCLTPLIVHEEPLGLLGLYHLTDRSWPDEEVALVEAFASQAAVAISNARLYRSVADQAVRMGSIQDLSARLNRLTDVRAIAEAIVAEASILADYNDIRVYTVDWESGWCEPVAFTKDMLGEGGDYEKRLRVPIGDGSFTGSVAESGEALLINDALNDDRGMTIEGTEDIDESMLLVPMVFEGRSLGVIVLSQLGFNRFKPDDVQTMTIFAGYAAQAFANATAYEQLTAQSAELARQLDTQRRLLDINERLLSTLDPTEILDTIADGLKSVVAYDNLVIHQFDREAGLLHPLLARDRHAAEVLQHQIPIGRGLTSWAVEHHEALLVNDALSDPRGIQIPGTPPDPEALIIVPLIADGEVIGAMNIGRIGHEEIYFSEADFELAKLFAGQASIALRNADEHHAVSLRADTDALSGLGNHGAFQRALSELLGAAEAARDERDRRVAMLMMDLDRFKDFNDSHGHPAGDALIHAAATAIYGAARSDDRVYRYGGDEFAIILPGSSAADAARVGERVRRAVASLTAGERTPVTITVGVAAFPEDAGDRSELVAAADAALYAGKQAGEDRVVQASNVPNEMRGLRGTLDQLARAALMRGEEPASVERIVEHATLLTKDADTREATVRDALLSVARSLDARNAANRGHSDRVSRLAGRIAQRLGCSADDLHSIELGARLHGLERAGLRELEPIPSLRGVGAIIRGEQALSAGPGQPRSRRGRIPIGAHVIAAANAYDQMTAGARRGRPGRAAALAALRNGVAGPIRSDVLDALGVVVADRRDPGSRRRSDDVETEERGAA